jgi:hypothetical protein
MELGYEKNERGKVWARAWLNRQDGRRYFGLWITPKMRGTGEADNFTRRMLMRALGDEGGLYAVAPDVESAQYLARFGFSRKHTFPPVFGSPTSLLCADFVGFNIAKPLNAQDVTGSYPTEAA